MAEIKLRGIDTPVRRVRKQIFTEVAKLAYSGEDLINVEKIPYLVTPGDTPKYRESIYRERAIARERIRLAMGMSLRPEDRPSSLTDGIQESNIAAKYYEPPLMQVIPSACNACENHVFEVSDQCKGCVARACMEVCPKDAISFVNGKSFIDRDKCIKCGKCKSVCPYDAIAEKRRPCADACGVNAIESDKNGKAVINQDVCVSCGMCMTSCPFGAIADKSQIFQLIRAMQTGKKMIAEVAPAFAGQFGNNISGDQIKAALKFLGFYDVYEVAIGADYGAVAEAKKYSEKIATGEMPFLLTSCCPSWAMLAKKNFPEIIDKISTELTPMVETARIIKQEHPDASVVFIGPCASKKLEASRRTIRSDVDFVITFEELEAIFEAKNVDFNYVSDREEMEDATSLGRGYGVAGGVAEAVEKCINEYYPDVEVKIQHAEGLAECKKMLLLAKVGKLDGYMIEGMACPGGCVGGAGTNIQVKKAASEVKKFAASADKQMPDKLEEE